MKSFVTHLGIIRMNASVPVTFDHRVIATEVVLRSNRRDALVFLQISRLIILEGQHKRVNAIHRHEFHPSAAPQIADLTVADMAAIYPLDKATGKRAWNHEALRQFVNRHLGDEN